MLSSVIECPNCVMEKTISYNLITQKNISTDSEIATIVTCLSTNIERCFILGCLLL